MVMLEVRGTFKALFIPALNKDGYCHLTFLRDEPMYGNIEVRNPQIQMNNLIFEVMGHIEGTSIEVSIPVEANYVEKNRLGKTLRAMGFPEPENEIFTNEDGFNLYKQNDIGKKILEFLKTQRGVVYTAPMFNENPDTLDGSWQIGVDTLKLLHLP